MSFEIHITDKEIAKAFKNTTVKIGYRILNNRITENTVVGVLGLSIFCARILDKVFHTRLNRALIDRMHDISRDRLNRLRITQIKHIFRKKFNLSKTRVKLAGGSYWLSIPCIVEGIDKKTKKEKKYMAKMINGMSALKHRYMSHMRNLGVMVEGADLKFDDYADARDMLIFERDSLNMLRSKSINTPDVLGLYRLNEDDYILVMEFIEGRPLSKVDLKDKDMDNIFSIMKTMHDNGLVHGDIKLDNFIYSGGRVFVLDCLKIDSSRLASAQAFDLMAAICALSQKVDVDTVIGHAKKYFSEHELSMAGGMLGVTFNKVDLDLSRETIDRLENMFRKHHEEPVTAT
ncbi:serine/threonine protein kinase [Methanocella sp. CWC-04]|uniref:non-specific serine/threonine protein kinase n=1 Tax=Methanooceanicella nereidis TaxID=2052831 RepID=A0AAP2RF41_9EURY|nr:lipopolysaccharide core heptose(II) kinase RfaY [Methanocella sp. CWC-04]MCD1296214.1 serine/threonine protein kinase [Methanocella sp. CWC-04]